MKLKIPIISTILVMLLVAQGCAVQEPTTATTPGPAPTAPVPAQPPSLAPAPSPPPAPASKPSPTPTPAPMPTATAPAFREPAALQSSIAALEEAIESIYSQVNPSVVNIQVIQKAVPFPTIPGFPVPKDQAPTRGLGSGFVWSTEGYIVTNNHVVSNADSVSVTFSDGTMVPARIVGTDSDSDLAAIKVEVPADKLRPVKMADSSRLRVGQFTIAIGNPFGLQGTMTVGFISGLGRLLPTDRTGTRPRYSIPDVIQTDAAINPGNSGGVLVDSSGSVIGVTFAIESQSGTSAGVGFVIPSAIVQKVVPELIQNGRYQHPYLGVSVMSLNPDIADAMGLKSDQRGALVSDVSANSPAEKADIRSSQRSVPIHGQQVTVGGDVVISFEGQPVTSSDDLVTLLARLGSIGKTVTLTILREGKEVRVQATLAARPSAQS